MNTLSLTRYEQDGVTLLGDLNHPGGVTLAFTERSGGVSKPPYSSLNLGDHVGDNLDDVLENRRRVLKSLNIEHLEDRLLVPKQTHSDVVVVVDDNSAYTIESIRKKISTGCDAIVVGVCDVPVMLCYADCVPVILVAPSGFAVIHSGWRGTIARISAKALDELCRVCHCAPEDVVAYIGPHIRSAEYEVSQDLMDSFTSSFGPEVEDGSCRLNLSKAIKIALIEKGMDEEDILDCEISTLQECERFFSYRAEEGLCGRHGAVACLTSSSLSSLS